MCSWFRDDVTSHLAFFLGFSYVLVALLSLLESSPPQILTFFSSHFLGEHTGFMVLSTKCMLAFQPFHHVSEPLSESPKSLEANFPAFLLLNASTGCLIGIWWNKTICGTLSFLPPSQYLPVFSDFLFCASALLYFQSTHNNYIIYGG